MYKKSEKVRPFAAPVLLLLFSFFLASCAGMGISGGPQAEFDAGMGLFNRGSFRDAALHFEKATAMDPSYGSAYLYLGRSYLNLMDYRKAVPPLRAAYRLVPDEVKKQAFDLLLDALLGAATSEKKEGHLKESVADLKEAYALNPKSERAKDELSQALVSLGVMYLAGGDSGEATRTLSEALKVSPDNISAYLALARAFLQRGDVKDAVDAIVRALRLDPTNQEALKLLIDQKANGKR